MSRLEPDPPRRRRRRRPGRPSPSFFVALLALIVATSGAAYAASIPRNSVGPPQLKKNAVTTPKIKKGAVTGAKISPRAKLALKGPPPPLAPTGETLPGLGRSWSGFGEKVVQTTVITVPEAARIMVAAGGTYERNNSGMDRVDLGVKLAPYGGDSEVEVAWTPASASATVIDADGDVPLSVTSVLAPLAVGLDRSYAAAPGEYRLTSSVWLSGSSCAGTARIRESYLTYVLLGTGS